MKKDKVTNPIERAVAESARARKLDAEARRKMCEACEKEDQQWRDEQGTMSRSARRREEKAERRAEASARRASARLLAEQEEKDLERISNKKKRSAKEIKSELQREREEALAAIQKKVEEEQRRKQKRVASKKEYERMILLENKNRAVIEARSIEEAVAALSRKENLQVCKIRATEGSKGDSLFVYTQGEQKPLLVNVRLIE